MHTVLPPPSPPPRLWCPQPQNVPLSIPPQESEAPPQKKEEDSEEESSEEESSEEEEEYDDTSSEGSVSVYIYPDEVNDTASPIKPTFSEDDPDEGFGGVDRAVWEKYYRSVKESLGFDITDYPGQYMMTTVFPMPRYLDDPKNVKTLEDYAGQAIQHYNEEKGTNYAVKEILKVNGGGCRDFIFYITFSVNTADEAIFQAKVVEDLDDSLSFPIIRPKPKKDTEMQ